MNYPLQAMIAMGAVPSVSFPADSRYYGSKTLQYVAPDGTMISYLARRFVPQPGAPNFATVATHSVRQGDRLDLIAANYVGTPLMYWLLCDANGAIRPDELVEESGRILNITMPQGVPGVGGGA